jgi:hypothetical protein
LIAHFRETACGVINPIRSLHSITRQLEGTVTYETRPAFAAMAIYLSTVCSAFAGTPSGVIRVDITLGPAVTAPSVFYVDPINGSLDGDGSRLKPWRTFAEVVGKKLINGEDSTKGVVHAGDVIYLLSGNHGSVTMNTYNGQFNNTLPITVQAMPTHAPVLNQLTLRNVSNWTFRGLTFVPPALAPGEVIANWFTLATFTDTNGVVFDKNTLYSQADVTAWSAQDWLDQSVCRAIYYTGNGCTISNNVIRNVRNGIAVGGDSVAVTGNVVDYFTNDAIDFTSSNTIIRANVITNHYGYLDNGAHRDAIQGWTVGGVTGHNILIDRNLVMSSTGQYTTIPPVASGTGTDVLQGISIFDGMWKDVVVTNNVVIVPAFHAISMYGVSSLNIQNNTAVTYSTSPGMVGWIGVFNKKDGTVPTRITVRNNIATSLSINVAGVTKDHNIVLTPKKGITDLVADPLKVFVTYKPALGLFDLHLAAGSPAIGAGGLPMLRQDKDGKTRVVNDCGAYAY